MVPACIGVQGFSIYPGSITPIKCAIISHSTERIKQFQIRQYQFLLFISKIIV